MREGSWVWFFRTDDKGNARTIAVAEVVTSSVLSSWLSAFTTSGDAVFGEAVFESRTGTPARRSRNNDGQECPSYERSLQLADSIRPQRAEAGEWAVRCDRPDHAPKAARSIEMSATRSTRSPS